MNLQICLNLMSAMIYGIGLSSLLHVIKDNPSQQAHLTNAPFYIVRDSLMVNELSSY